METGRWSYGIILTRHHHHHGTETRSPIPRRDRLHSDRSRALQYPSYRSLTTRHGKSAVTFSRPMVGISVPHGLHGSVLLCCTCEDHFFG